MSIWPSIWEGMPCFALSRLGVEAPIVETSFTKLAVIFPTFHLEYPSVLSGFCLQFKLKKYAIHLFQYLSFPSTKMAAMASDLAGKFSTSLHIE